MPSNLRLSTNIAKPIIPEKPVKKLTLLEQVRLDVGLVSRDPMSSDPNAMDIGERGDSGYKPSRSKRSKKGDRKSDKADKNEKSDKKDKKKKKKKKKSHRTRTDEQQPENADATSKVKPLNLGNLGHQGTVNLLITKQGLQIMSPTIFLCLIDIF